MVQDFINHLITGLARKMILIGLLLSASLLCFFILMFGLSVRSSIVNETRGMDARITTLINQQQRQPTGLVSVYTLDTYGNV